jgi:uncharacterized lipoprotein YajG
MTLRLILPLTVLALLAACQPPDPRANTMTPVNASLPSAQSVDMMDDSIAVSAAN